MTIRPVPILRTARALWARDRAILLPLAGLFLFVPQWALLLLVPALPAIGEGTSPEAALAAFSGWASANAPLYLGAALVSQFGMLSAAALYVGPGAGQAGTALARAARLFPRFLLALAMVWLPLALAASLLLTVAGPAVAFPAAPVLFVGALAIMMLVAPAVAMGEPAGRAVLRCWTATKGSRLPLLALAGGVAILGQVVAAVPVSLVQAMASKGTANPVAVALLDAGAGVVIAASSLLLALAGVVAYRVLAGSVPR